MQSMQQHHGTGCPAVLCSRTQAHSARGRSTDALSCVCTSPHLPLQIMSGFIPYIPQEQGTSMVSATPLAMQRVTTTRFTQSVAGIVR